VKDSKSYVVAAIVDALITSATKGNKLIRFITSSPERLFEPTIHLSPPNVTNDLMLFG
jgi:hypothetical protein